MVVHSSVRTLGMTGLQLFSTRLRYRVCNFGMYRPVALVGVAFISKPDGEKILTLGLGRQGPLETMQK